MKFITLFVASVFLAWELRSFYKALSAGGTGHIKESASIRARPLMFMFLFTWALPLSFVPLNAAALPVHFLSLPRELVMAAPLSTEMGCALITATIAGWLSDRIGWQKPVFFGFALSFAGSFVASIASSFEMFLVARALTGLGYGLTWMGIQALVVHHTAANVMTFSIANITAGIFTGYMLGTFTGGLLADVVGYAGVFFFGTLALGLPIGYALALPRAYFRAPQPRSAVVTPKREPGAGRLLKSRDFCALLIASIVPFSIAQVSLLNYGVPVFLNSAGQGTSEIGSILAMYSAIFVFLAPPLARRIDGRENKRIFVLAGALLGSFALSSLYFVPNLFGVVVATAVLAFASSIGSAAQTSYALQLDAVKTAGAGLATGIQRSADKFGQMLGPLIVGALYSATSLPIALALTGAIYLVATLVFYMITKQPANRRGEMLRPQVDPPSGNIAVGSRARR